MKKVRISKYDPKFRDIDGTYQKDEWTSISDIGKIFQGEKFDFSSYLKIEEKYIKATKVFMNNWESIVISDLEKGDFYPKYFPDLNLISFFDSIEENTLLPISNMENLVRLILRECLWCKLKNVNDDTLITFGYDYYMYFNADFLTPSLIEEFRRIGLFVDFDFVEKIEGE